MIFELLGFATHLDFKFVSFLFSQIPYVLMTNTLYFVPVCNVLFSRWEECIFDYFKIYLRDSDYIIENLGLSSVFLCLYTYEVKIFVTPLCLLGIAINYVFKKVYISVNNFTPIGPSPELGFVKPVY